ncbi:MAG: HD domain-containing phosphohydrolase, partial [Acidobacteriota bacterium]
AFTDALSRLLTAEGFAVDVVHDSDGVVDAVTRCAPDVVLLDVELPSASGFEVCRTLKRTDATRLIPIVLLTGLVGREHRLAGIEAGADDFLTKPFDSSELTARVRSLARLKRYTDELESAESVIVSLALTVEARDAYTDGHCDRLSSYATALGRALGLSRDELSALKRGGLLHDVGKVGIPDAVLLKEGRLTNDEYELVKQHSVIGERLCSGLRSLAGVRPIIRQHHERLDGSGYPDGLKGHDVSLLAQIIGVVDAFDAMTTDRPYRASLGLDRALDELRRDAARGAMDRALVETFVTLAPALLAAAPGVASWGQGPVKLVDDRLRVMGEPVRQTPAFGIYASSPS